MNRTLIVALMLTAGVAARAADVAYAPPMGGMTLSVPAAQTRSLSFPLVHSTVAGGAVVGRITAVGSNFIENSAANWTAGSLSNSANPHYVRIRTGAAAGRVFMVSTTANTATRATLTTDGADLTQLGIVTGASGDVYELVLADTLADLFGGVVQGGADATSADNVQVWSGATWLTFYYNTTRSRWERDVDTASSPARDNFVLRPDRGVMVARRAASAMNLRIVGRVPEVAPRHAHARPGLTFLSVGVPVGATLGQLALQTGAAGWRGGASYATALSDADLIQVWSGATWLNFYFDTTNARWQRAEESAQTSRDSFVVPAGRPIMVRRLDSGSGVVSLPKPYSIAL